MTGRGRGRLLRDQRQDSDPNCAVMPAADINDLFNVQRSPNEIFKIIKANILDTPFSLNKLRSCLETVVKNMIQDSTNAIEICKYIYVCSCYSDKKVGTEIRSQFFNILEIEFKEICNFGDQTNEDAVHNFVKFFIVAIHFMRNPNVPPKDDIISAILILISRLSKTSNDDRNLYCQAVAWLSSYKNSIEAGGTILSQAFTEAVNQVREWILDGVGGHWAMACLEATCSEGLLPPSSRPFYSKTLSRLQFSCLTDTSYSILIPATEKSKFNFTSLHSINYID